MHPAHHPFGRRTAVLLGFAPHPSQPPHPGPSTSQVCQEHPAEKSLAFAAEALEAVTMAILLIVSFFHCENRFELKGHGRHELL